MIVIGLLRMKKLRSPFPLWVYLPKFENSCTVKFSTK